MSLATKYLSPPFCGQRSQRYNHSKGLSHSWTSRYTGEISCWKKERVSRETIVNMQVSFLKNNHIIQKICMQRIYQIEIKLFPDCIKDEFNAFYELEQNDIFSTCNVPWTANITGNSMYEHKPCNLSDATNQSVHLIDFFTKASMYRFPNCQGMTYWYIYINIFIYILAI